MMTCKMMKRWLACVAVAAVGVLLVPTASAVSPTELLRVEQNQSFQGACCFSWLEKVKITEPASVVPVVVTLSTDYQATGFFFIGISLNGGICQFYGSSVLAPTSSFDNFFDSQTHQWVIMPGDGLVPGKNTFTLCGGGFSPTDIVTLGFNTLSVRISK